MVADQFLDIARDHAGEHHAEGHESGANGVVGGLLRAFTEEHHEVGEGGEAETVAELFDSDTGRNEPHGGWMGKCQIDVDEVGKVHGGGHPPNPVL